MQVHYQVQNKHFRLLKNIRLQLGSNKAWCIYVHWFLLSLQRKHLPENENIFKIL